LSDQLDVTEGGALVFLVRDETVYVFPFGNLDAARYKVVHAAHVE